MTVTAALLLSDDPICDEAESYARAHLQVVQVQRHPRSAKVLAQRPIGATLLLNFLSAPKIKAKGYRGKFIIPLPTPRIV